MSVVTPELGVNTPVKAFFAALRYVKPSVSCSFVSEKSRMTQSKDEHTMSFKSLATVVVMSRVLPPKLRALIFPALLVDNIEAEAPFSAFNSL